MYWEIVAICARSYALSGMKLVFFEWQCSSCSHCLPIFPIRLCFSSLALPFLICRCRCKCADKVAACLLSNSSRAMSSPNLLYVDVDVVRRIRTGCRLFPDRLPHNADLQGRTQKEAKIPTGSNAQSAIHRQPSGSRVLAWDFQKSHISDPEILAAGTTLKNGPEIGD